MSLDQSASGNEKVKLASSSDAPLLKTSPSNKKNNLFKSTGTVSILTLLSRVLGLVRDVVLAHMIGASGMGDAFLVAFKIPNFMRRLFAEGAFAQAFVPVFSEVKTKGDLFAIRAFVSYVTGGLGSILLSLTLLGSIFSHYIIIVFAPGFLDHPEKLMLAGDLLRITFPYLLLISLTALSGSILNTYQLFSVSAFAPVILNVVLIISAYIGAHYFAEPVYALAWGVLVAGALQWMVHWPSLLKLQMFVKPRINFEQTDVKKIFALMLPALLSVSVSQISLLLDTIWASFLETGSVSWLYYGDRLMELPLGMFGIAIGTVILPTLSRKHASNSKASFSHTLNWALKLVLFLGLPSAVALAVLSEEILCSLFQYGKFSWHDVQMSANSLKAYSFGILAFMLVKVLAPGYFSRQDTKTPVKAAIVAMIANMVLSFALMWPFNHVGLALATSLAGWVNALQLWFGLIKDRSLKMESDWFKFLFKLILSACFMAAILTIVSPAEVVWREAHLYIRLLYLCAMVSLGCFIYFASLWVMGIRPRHLQLAADSD